jgi:hypothetical protein
MPQWNSSKDDEPLSDGSVPISGVNNAQPPNSIDQTQAADAENRLTQADGLNRPRPGIIRKAMTGGSFDSIHHLGVGVFLLNDANKWWTYDSRSNVLAAASGGPAYTHGAQVYSALTDTVLYFSDGNALRKYTPGTGFGAVTLPAPYTTAKFPIWALYRLMYAFENTLIVSDILDPEVFDLTNQLVTLDPVRSDAITGMCLWQNQTLAVFRNGSTWMIETGPNLAVVDWEVNRGSATVGCAAHGTIVQCGVDVFFLSETGRGVYALSQMPTSNQMGVWAPISQPIQGYIDRINWTAIKNARAVYWNGLYLLSVPMDLSSVNNFVLVFSVALNTWQGLWCFDINSTDVAVRDMARDRTNPDATVLMAGTIDGQIFRFSYPADDQFYDQDIDNTKHDIHSHLLTRSFTFGETTNQIQPYSSRFQFLGSENPVDITVIANRTIDLYTRTAETSGNLLQLPIPGFTFDLDKGGYYNLPISLMNVGVCSELQFLLTGYGNWTLYQIKLTAFEAAPLVAT